MSAQPPDEVEEELPAAPKVLKIPRPVRRGSSPPAVSEETSPAVPLEPDDEEREETIVGDVSAGLLALSALPPGMPSMDFEEKTEAFTAPQELLELARRERDARTQTPEQEGATSEEALSETASGEEAEPDEGSFAVLANSDSVSASEPAGSRVSVDTVNTVVAPPVPAHDSSICPPGHSEAPESAATETSDAQPKALWSSEIAVLVAMLSLLIGYWVSVLWL